MRTALLGAVALVALLAAAPATSKPATLVHLRDDAFSPATITVRAGDTVTFQNDDDDAHTVTADDGSWDSEGLNQNEKWSHTFAKPGTIKYHCTVHPFMRGSLIVRAK